MLGSGKAQFRQPKIVEEWKVDALHDEASSPDDTLILSFWWMLDLVKLQDKSPLSVFTYMQFKQQGTGVQQVNAKRNNWQGFWK